MKLNFSTGGTLSSCLNALIACDFVVRYVPFGLSGKEEHYKLTDPFCLFYLHFMRSRPKTDPHFWLDAQDTPEVSSWRGFAFETVCFNHVVEIKKALGISGVKTTHSAWSKRSDDADGTQIDLLIDRSDHVLNCCEIKFYSEEVTVDKAYDRVLRHRHELLRGEISPKTAIRNTLITTYGLKRNEYSGSFSDIVTMDDLFEPV